MYFTKRTEYSFHQVILEIWKIDLELVFGVGVVFALFMGDFLVFRVLLHNAFRHLVGT